MPTKLSILAHSNTVTDIDVPNRPVSSKWSSFFKLVRDSINTIRKKRKRIAPVSTTTQTTIIHVAVADGKNDGRDFFCRKIANAQLSLNPVKDQSTNRVGGYTHINDR